MKHIRYVAATLAVACAFVAGSAWADAASVTANEPANDRAISRQIATNVLQDAAVGPYGVRVRTQDGRVHLSGSVATIRDWKQADRDARGTTGVSDVQNDLSILVR